MLIEINTTNDSELHKNMNAQQKAQFRRQQSRFAKPLNLRVAGHESEKTNHINLVTIFVAHCAAVNWFVCQLLLVLKCSMLHMHTHTHMFSV